jgi:hypothetical protein
VAELLRQVRASPELAAIDGPVLVAVNGDDRYIQVGDTIGTRLAIDGRPILWGPSARGFVHPSRILDDTCAADHVLVISLLRGEVAEPEGVEVARVDGAPGLDREALDRLVEQAAGVDFVAGDGLTAALAEDPESVLLVRSNLDLLIEHPPTSPELDRAELEALRASLPEGADSVVATELAAHLTGSRC